LKIINSLPISEVFNSIQGEGFYTGRPVRFIRVSGCTRKCSFCDSKYHIKGKQVLLKNLVRDAVSQNLRTLVITGGEPLLYWRELVRLWELLNKEKHFNLHLETNGDLLFRKKVMYSELFSVFDYSCISPKSLSVAKKLYSDLSGPLSKGFCDIKIVADLSRENRSMRRYATMLMPLTTNNPGENASIQKRVWDYCVKNGVRYSPRLHIELFGKSRGV
jgi:organic radical activating enzyme